MPTSTRVQLRRGTAVQVAAFTGAEGEVTPDMSNKRLVLHDGVTAGGFPQASEAFVTNTVAGAVAGINVPALTVSLRQLFK